MITDVKLLQRDSEYPLQHRYWKIDLAPPGPLAIGVGIKFLGGVAKKTKTKEASVIKINDIP